VQQAAAIFAAVGKVAGEHFTRDDLPDGAAHRVLLQIAGQVEGCTEIYRRDYVCDMTVGHKSERASSTAAPQQDVVGWILDQLSESHRNAICRNMPEVFAANNESLPVKAETRERAEAMLKCLRQKSTQEVRGSVRVVPSESAAPLNLIG
jgi:hypothetical protein